MGMEIRLLNENDDLYAVSRIYKQSWKFAYQRIAPQEYLDNIPTGNWIEKAGFARSDKFKDDNIGGTYLRKAPVALHLIKL